MGAATALLHGDRDPSIAALVLDSAFADLTQLAEEMVERGRQAVSLDRVEGGEGADGMEEKGSTQIVLSLPWVTPATLCFFTIGHASRRPL